MDAREAVEKVVIDALVRLPEVQERLPAPEFAQLKHLRQVGFAVVAPSCVDRSDSLRLVTTHMDGSHLVATYRRQDQHSRSEISLHLLSCIEIYRVCVSTRHDP